MRNSTVAEVNALVEDIYMKHIHVYSNRFLTLQLIFPEFSMDIRMWVI